jgi:hypothetical protein
MSKASAAVRSILAVAIVGVLITNDRVMYYPGEGWSG